MHPLWLGCPITSILYLEQTLAGTAFLRSLLWILLFYGGVFFLLPPPPSSFLHPNECTIVVFLAPAVPCSTLSPCSLGLVHGCSKWAGWEAPDWLQAVPLPGLTFRHCFCPLNRINKSMCQVDCSQETMTQFWHQCLPHPFHLSPSPPFLPHCSF